MTVSRKEAEELGLEVHRLLTWDFDLGNPRRLKVGEVAQQLLYSLDDLQLSTRVYKRTLDSVPPDTLTCAQTGLPLRPLYINAKDGIVKRVVPISWNEGVDYLDWQAAQESEA